KLNPLKEAIRGLRLVVVDDSIVRGNTTKAIVAILREAGAREVHVRITSPPVRWPCFYGIDMPTRAELVASDLRTDEVASYIGADSLGYLSLDALTEPSASPKESLKGLAPPRGPPMDPEPITSAEAGVDVDAGDRAVALMRASVEATHGPRVLGGIGGGRGAWGRGRGGRRGR